VATIGTDIERAAAYLLAGNCIGIPTETVYGLAASIYDSEAIGNIFRIKGRPDYDPLIVHCSSIASAMEMAKEVPAAALKLAERFWPGPLTLVLNKKESVSPHITSGLDTVGLRVPSHPLMLSLLNRVNVPLAAPSANPFGYISPTSAAHVQEHLGDQIPYILDGGDCPLGIESTIVGFVDNTPIVLRLGSLPIEDIEACVGKVLRTKHSSSRPQAPGMLISHYAPRKPVFPLHSSEIRKSDGLLLLRAHKEYASHELIEILSSNGDLFIAARHLYAALRRLDATPCERILAELPGKEGMGGALRDRLIRAMGEGFTEG
jgi:L-threonylcarbamoyladenylate synthase